MKLINQINSHTCVHACLSMVSGFPIRGIIEELGDQALELKEEIGFLIKHGISFNQLIYTTMFNGTYLVTVPSLNKKGYHRVVVICDDGDVEVFDPNEGLDKEFYDQVKFLNSRWSEVLQVA